MNPLDIETARDARDEALGAIQGLLRSLALIENRMPSENYQRMHKAIGLAIGKVEVEYLRHIYSAHPELDDLVNQDSVAGSPNGSISPKETQ